MKYNPHPAADILPLKTDDELEAFSEQLKVEGQLHPIITWNGQIVDGRNRFKACELAGIDPIFEEREFADDAAVRDYVRKTHFNRRDLSPSQKAMFALRFHYEKKPVKILSGDERKMLSKLYGVSEGTLAYAHLVVTKGSKRLIKRVEKGEKSVKNVAESLKKKLATEQKDSTKSTEHVEVSKSAESQENSHDTGVMDLDQPAPPLPTTTKPIETKVSRPISTDLPTTLDDIDLGQAFADPIATTGKFQFPKIGGPTDGGYIVTPDVITETMKDSERTLWRRLNQLRIKIDDPLGSVCKELLAAIVCEMEVYASDPPQEAPEVERINESNF